jgi:2-(1,2-epoxy-1,2-dihydrophenyl)acetyl-CoA isomerase
MTNRILTANEALEWGLVNKVVDFNELKNESVNLAQQLAEGPLLRLVN